MSVGGVGGAGRVGPVDHETPKQQELDKILKQLARNINTVNHSTGGKREDAIDDYELTMLDLQDKFNDYTLILTQKEQKVKDALTGKSGGFLKTYPLFIGSDQSYWGLNHNFVPNWKPDSDVMRASKQAEQIINKLFPPDPP